MTASREIELPSAATSAKFLGQATAVEQARSVAEVQAMVIVARSNPRDIQAAVEEMREVCKQQSLADRAFYRYSRGGQTVSDGSIYLARELMRIWGNADYGIAELRRDDAAAESEMKAWAWDMEKNSRNSNTFIVPHKRDKRGGPEVLTDLRDVYENNTNQAARRVRECIFAVLPKWFVEDAKNRCITTIKEGGGVPLPQRISDAIGRYAAIGVTADQLEAKVGRQKAKWNEHDVAQLAVIYQSISRGEINREEEFPPERLTVEELTAAPTVMPTSPAAVNGAAQPATGNTQSATETMVSREQLDRLTAALAKVGVTERVDRLSTVSKLAGRTLETTSHLAAAKADEVVATLERLAQRDEPARELDVYLANLDEGEAQG